MEMILGETLGWCGCNQDGDLGGWEEGLGEESSLRRRGRAGTPCLCWIKFRHQERAPFSQGLTHPCAPWCHSEAPRHFPGRELWRAGNSKRQMLAPGPLLSSDPAAGCSQEKGAQTQGRLNQGELGRCFGMAEAAQSGQELPAASETVDTHF